MLLSSMCFTTANINSTDFFPLNHLEFSIVNVALPFLFVADSARGLVRWFSLNRAYFWKKNLPKVLQEWKKWVPLHPLSRGKAVKRWHDEQVGWWVPDWPSILPCNAAREREKRSGKISEKFSRKNLGKICTVKINHLPLHPLSLQNGKPSSLKDFR